MAKIEMTREIIKDKVIKIVRESLPEFKDVEIHEDTRLNTQQALDSMTFIYLMCQIEAEFNINIPQKKWDKMVTLADVIDAIMRAM
jgi:acyl carrier protein